MKKIFKMMMAVVAGFAALTACTNEPEEGVTPDNTQEYCIVKVGMSKATKGSLTDAEGIKWEVGDQIKYAGGVELTSEALTAEDIEDDGYTANFKFAASLNEVDRTGWFVSTKCHPSNYNEVEFTLGTEGCNVYSQAVAGEMNSRYLFLHSGTGLVNITQGEVPVVNMDIAGAIFRIMPYTETYSNEVVKSVELTSNNGKHIVGTVAYDRGGGTYTSANEVAGSGWRAYPFVRIRLDEPFALTNANSRENSKGIYMAIARTTETHPIEGYTITVKTDKATYTFSSDDNLVVGENELRNVYLKLENGSRVDNSAPKGTLKYNSGINASQTVPDTGCAAQSAGYSYASVLDKGLEDVDANWVTKEGANNVQYYNSVVFECIDNATGSEAEWLKVYYKKDGSSTHWHIDADAQEAGAPARSATVTATYPDVVDGYYLLDGYKTKTITVTQLEYSGKTLFAIDGGRPGNQTIPAEGGERIETGAYAVVLVDGGTRAVDFANDSHNEQIVYGSSTFVAYVEGTGVGAGATVADWITIGYGRDADNKINSEYLFINAQPNTSASERRVNVLCTYIAPEGYMFADGSSTQTHQFLITQEAYKASIAATLNDVYAGTVSYEGEEITVGNLAMTADGEAVADANEFCNVAINGGASVALAADGTITATIPANGTTEAKTYTITVKDTKGNTLATAEFTQEAGDGSGEVVEGPLVTDWTLRIIHGAKYVGFGSQVLNAGDGYGISSVTIDGKVYNSAALLAELTSEQLRAVIDTIFEIQEYESSELEVPSAPIYSVEEQKEMFVLEPRVAGAEICVALVFQNTNQTGKLRYVKVCCNKADGSQDVKYYFQTQ